jgi:hypothetical protein
MHGKFAVEPVPIQRRRIVPRIPADPSGQPFRRTTGAKKDSPERFAPGLSAVAKVSTWLDQARRPWPAGYIIRRGGGKPFNSLD